MARETRLETTDLWITGSMLATISLWQNLKTCIDNSIHVSWLLTLTSNTAAQTHQIDLQEFPWKSPCSSSRIQHLLPAVGMALLLPCPAPGHQVQGRHAVHHLAFPPLEACQVSWSWPAVSDKHGTVTACWEGWQWCDCVTHSLSLTNKINEKQSPPKMVAFQRILLSCAYELNFVHTVSKWDSHLWLK